MHRFKLRFCYSLALVLVWGSIFTGCSNLSGSQFTLDTFGNFNMTTGGAAGVKFGFIGSQDIPVEGTAIIEIQEETPEGFFFQMQQFSAFGTNEEFGDVTIFLEPNSVSQGFLFKRVNGQPLGESTMNVVSQVQLSTPQTLDQGSVDFSASVDVPNELINSTEFPVINFDFEGLATSAQTTDLLFLMGNDLAQALEQ